MNGKRKSRKEEGRKSLRFCRLDCTSKRDQSHSRFVMVSFTLTEVETDTETEKYMACMKLYRRVHTDRDPSTIEYNGVGIGLRDELGQCE